MTTILGIKLNQRMSSAKDFQDILSKYGCSIKSRIGLHNVADGVCSPDGVILLELIGDQKEIDDCEKELVSFEACEVQKMVF